MVQLPTQPRPDRMTRFERAVVFRVARGYFFAMAIAAVALFLGGVVVGTCGLVKPPVPPPVVPDPPAPRAPISYAAVQAELERETEISRQAGNTIYEEQAPRTGVPSSTSDPLQERLDALVKELQALFADPAYTWTNQMEQVCAAPTSFGCLRWETRLKKAGVVGVINAALKGMNKQTTVDYLEVLVRLLNEVPVEKRLDMVNPIVRTEQSSQAAQEEIELSHRAAVAEIERAHRGAVEENDTKHEKWKEWGLYGLGTGFALLVLVSLFLAFLSMERHSRILEKLMNAPPYR